MLRRQVGDIVRLACSVSSLGADRRARLAILLLGLALPLKRRLPFTRERAVRLRLRKLGQEFAFTVVDRSDFVILNEVLVAESYELPDLADPRTIVDLGANVGASVAFFRLRYPRADIVACEPSPDVFQRLEENVGSMRGVTLRRTAVADRNGSVPFRVSEHSLTSSMVAGAPGREIKVESATLDSLLEESSIEQLDLLKIDIEGAEFGVLSAFSGLDRTRAIAGEVHLDLMPQDLDDFFGLLDGFDVRRRPMPLPDIPSADRWTFEAVRAGGDRRAP